MMTPRDFPTRQREVVRSLFIRQSEVRACATPLRTMRGDSASARAFVSEEVGEFVEQRATDFRVAKFTQPRIQPHERAARKCEPGGAAHAGVPFEADPLRECWRTDGTQQRTGFLKEWLPWLGDNFHLLRRSAYLASRRTIPFSKEVPEKIELHPPKLRHLAAKGEHRVILEKHSGGFFQSPWHTGDSTCAAGDTHSRHASPAR